MRTVKRTYDFFITLPDCLYPFSCTVEGRRVRGRRSYLRAVARARHRHGNGRLGYKLTVYREAFHLMGSVLLIVSATQLSKMLFGSDAALYMLLGTAVAALSFQEFYLHPKRYGQHMRKGVIDWLSWVTPIILYFILLK